MLFHIDAVVIEDTATPQEFAAVAEAFAQAGFDVEIQAAVGRKSADQLPWIVLLVLGEPFFKTFREEAARDAYAELKTLWRKIVEARRRTQAGGGSIELFDTERSRLVLPSSIPEEAIDALGDFDWSDTPRIGVLTWDSALGEWRLWDSTVGSWRDAFTT